MFILTKSRNVHQEPTYLCLQINCTAVFGNKVNNTPPEKLSRTQFFIFYLLKNVVKLKGNIFIFSLLKERCGIKVVSLHTIKLYWYPCTPLYSTLYLILQPEDSISFIHSHTHHHTNTFIHKKTLIQILA